MGTAALQTTNLFLLEDLEDVRTEDLAERDLAALRSVADWIRSYIVKPHEDLGRAGPVCPFVPGVVSDWKFFLDNKELFDLWARRFGESGAQALAEELRHLPWRARRD